MRHAICFLAVLVTLLSALDSFGEQVSPVEQERIRYVIDRIGKMEEVTFVRNGTGYGAKTAAYFLARKWEANRDKVRTFDDFIEQVASRSSTTGKPYLIRLKDGKEMESGKFMRELDRGRNK